ncbi:MAG: phosphoglycerate kinase [Pseudomonadota bacterium]
MPLPPFLTMDQLDVSGRIVLLRADLNVPVQDGKVMDTSRIDRLQPTIQSLHSRGAKCVVMAHFGRPKGVDDSQSLRHILPALRASWGQPVAFAADCIGDIAQNAVKGMRNGDILLLENLRFHEGEEKNDPRFTAALAALGDIYINDAFSAAHRAHASTAGLAKLLPAAAGLLMQEELNALFQILDAPERPLGAIVGGAKVSTKLDLLGNLTRKVDILMLGGAMANTFLCASGVSVGTSLVETDMVATARQIMDNAMRNNCRIVLPVDAVCAAELAADQQIAIHPVIGIPGNLMILDIGPESRAAFCDEIAACRTLVWNGPVGAFETSPFEAGTTAIATFIADRVASGTLCAVAGGGDTVSALDMAGQSDGMSYTSTAGGAFLEWLEGKVLPGIAALMKAR